MTLLDECKKLLLSRMNLVLTGAPGTGKTYLAKEIAASIVGNCSWEKLTPEQKNQIGFVQFHPSYDYTDFVEGLRPTKDGSFCRQDGIFKEFCKRALEKLEDWEITGTVAAAGTGELSGTDVDGIDIDKLFEYAYKELLKRILKARPTIKINGVDRKITIENTRTGKTIVFGKGETNHPKYAQKEILSDLFRIYFEDFWDGKITKDHIKRLTRSDIRKVLQKEVNQVENRWALGEILEIAKNKVQSLFIQVNNPDEGIHKEQSAGKPNFIFIIDEINRGELSKIFGELFYSIEPDYRGPKGTVRTQYNNLVDKGDVFYDGFFIPENVYIIGTMNDIDRGVEAMDFAIRRRFAWKEVTWEESAKNMGIIDPAKAVMEALNYALIEQGLTKEYCIGGAYFRKLEGDDFKALWNYHLEGIISEYFRGEPDAQEKLKNIKTAYGKAVEKASGKAGSESTTDVHEELTGEVDDAEHAESAISSEPTESVKA